MAGFGRVVGKIRITIKIKIRSGEATPPPYFYPLAARCSPLQPGGARKEPGNRPDFERSSPEVSPAEEIKITIKITIKISLDTSRTEIRKGRRARLPWERREYGWHGSFLGGSWVYRGLSRIIEDLLGFARFCAVLLG
jgi:hypothetical protein